MSAEYKEVKTKYGLLRGQIRTSALFAETTYYSFLGIPFAKPPVGHLRFKDPQEPESWPGVRDALVEGNKSCQYEKWSGKCIGDEDCLYLNVYTTDPNTEGKAVMVWIHEGSFILGSATGQTHGPEYLLEHDVVLVATNYRLGALGFLCLGNSDVPGNAGLKDQVMALKWVQDNISSFGGDPNNVTLFGEGAGAVCVHYHLLSPLSKGLFHRVIIQSGSVFNPGSYMDTKISVERAFKLGCVLGHVTEKPDELVKFLQKLSPYKITNAQFKVVPKLEKWLNFERRFVPCAELPGTGQCFLPGPPKELFKAGLFTRVPTIMGITNNEGCASIEASANGELNFGKINKEFDLLIPPDLGLIVGSVKSRQLSDKIKKFYFSDKQPSLETVDNLITLFGDINFQNGFDKALNCFLEFSHTPYIYYFQCEITFSLIKALLKLRLPNVEFKGFTHGDDVHLIFSNPDFARSPESADFALSSKVTKAWTHFAKTGNPNYPGMETEWVPSSLDKLCYLGIGKEWKMINERISSDRMKFWSEIFDKIS